MKFFNIMVLGLVMMSGVSPTQAQSQIDIEMQSLRALAPGYRAWCFGGNLLFRSTRSAKFRIGSAALCVGKPDGYVVCSSDTNSSGKDGRAPPPPCSTISAPGA